MSKPKTYCRVAVAVASFMLVFTNGCQREEPIRTYRIAKDTDDVRPESARPSSSEPPSAAASDADSADADTEPTDRMLAAIFTNGDRVWTFKFTGPVDEVSRHADAFAALLRSVRFNDAGEPTWQLPDGWEQQPASGMRYATLVPEPANQDVDFSVIVLPAPQDILANVNRWRGQMQLPEIPAHELATAASKSTTASGNEVTVVDIEGKLQAGMMAPFAGGVPPVERRPLPPSSDRVPPPAVRESATESPVRFTVPAGWSARPTRLSQIHVFQVADGDQSAEISISVLGRAGGELLPNINRWRSQLGLEPWTADELATALSDREIAGMEAKWVELMPEETDVQRATIGAIGYRDDSAWFFKITGDKDLVRRERDRFDEFVRSIEFTMN